MGTDKGPACAAPDDVEEYFIGTPLVSLRSHKCTLDDRWEALKTLMKDSETEEKKNTEASAPHAFYTHALTNNFPAHSQPYDEWKETSPPKDVAFAGLSNFSHRPIYEKAPVAAPVMTPVTAPVNDVKFDSLATSITEGSSSDDSCTDDGSGDEVNSAELVHDFVAASSEQDFDDGWVDLQRVTQVTMDMCAIS